jgi:transposase, IS605 family, orfA and orfB fusion
MGTKKLARNDMKEFKLHRDSQINYIGRACEKQGNTNFQMQYIKKGNFFVMKVRRDFGKWKDDRSPERFAYGKCHFKYGGRQLRDAMRDNASTVTVSVIRRNGRYYLFVTVAVSYESSAIVTRKEHGVIGIDFNKGFINICETDEKGNIVSIEKMKYPFEKAGITKAGLSDVVSRTCKKAIETGKSIVAEDLSFERKKRKSKKAVTPTEKERMRMLHSLPYSRYAQILENITFNRKIELIKVNPAYTSKIAEQKFCDRMKLNIHNGASYVIARKGMGIKDSFKKTG